MQGSMNCCGDLGNLVNMGIVCEDAIMAAENWGKIFDFTPPAPVDCKSFWQSMVDDGSAIAWPPIYRDKAYVNCMPENCDGKQLNIIQKKYAFELKTPMQEIFNREYYDKYGNGVCCISYEEGLNRNHMVAHLTNEFGCTMINYMKYGENDPYRGDWCCMDTEELLGVNLVLKNDGYSGYKTFPQMDDFDALTIVVPDVKKTVRNWAMVFGIKTPKVRTVTSKAIYRGEEMEITFKAAQITEGAYLINFIEPVEAKPFSDYLAPRKNGGVLSVCMEMEEDDQEEIRKKVKEFLENDVLLEYDLFGRHFKVFDTLESLAIPLSVY